MSSVSVTARGKEDGGKRLGCKRAKEERGGKSKGKAAGRSVEKHFGDVKEDHTPQHNITWYLNRPLTNLLETKQPVWKPAARSLFFFFFLVLYFLLFSLDPKGHSLLGV